MLTKAASRHMNNELRVGGFVKAEAVVVGPDIDTSRVIVEASAAGGQTNDTRGGAEKKCRTSKNELYVSRPKRGSYVLLMRIKVGIIHQQLLGWREIWREIL